MIEAFPCVALAETLLGFAKVVLLVVLVGRDCVLIVLISIGVAGAGVVEVGTSGIGIAGSGATTFVWLALSAGTGSIDIVSVVWALAEAAINNTTIVTKSAQIVEDTEIGLCCLYIELR